MCLAQYLYLPQIAHSILLLDKDCSTKPLYAEQAKL